MTTSLKIYEDLAVKYGDDIDINDPDAVQHFFEYEVHSLPRENQLAIIESIFIDIENGPHKEVDVPDIVVEQVPFPKSADNIRANDIVPSRRLYRGIKRSLVNSVPDEIVKTRMIINEVAIVNELANALNTLKEITNNIMHSNELRSGHKLSDSVASISRRIRDLEDQWEDNNEKEAAAKQIHFRHD